MNIKCKEFKSAMEQLKVKGYAVDKFEDWLRDLINDVVKSTKKIYGK